MVSMVASPIPNWNITGENAGSIRPTIKLNTAGSPITKTKNFSDSEYLKNVEYPNLKSWRTKDNKRMNKIFSPMEMIVFTKTV